MAVPDHITDELLSHVRVQTDGRFVLEVSL